MKYCPNCSWLAPAMKFCVWCGFNLTGVADEADYETVDTGCGCGG